MAESKKAAAFAPAAEIFLVPGEFHFCHARMRIRTLLGSCVALTMWHPLRRLGGMSHSLLPRRGRSAPGPAPDGRYLDEALCLFEAAARRHHTALREYHIKIFGGADMFPGVLAPASMRVGERNINEARRLLAQWGLRIAAENVGGSGDRAVIFDVASGETWFRQRASKPEPHR